MPGLLKTLKNWIGDCYNYLGLVLIASLAWSGTALVALAIIFKLASGSIYAVLTSTALFYVLAIAPVTAGVSFMARRIVSKDDPAPLDLVTGTRELLASAWLLGLAQVLLTLALSVNAWFYLTRDMIAFRLLGVVFIYALLLWALSSMYHYAILVAQRPGVFNVIKRSFLLALDNVGFTAGVFSAIILLTCFCAVLPPGMVLLYAGMLSLLQANALRSLFVKYDLPEAASKVPVEQHTVSEDA